MLNELETLSQNIGRLIALNERHLQARHALEEQLAQVRRDNEAARAELALLRDERNALQAERDALVAKIDDAQVRLNAILEKLPSAKGHPDADSQLDLLAASNGDDDASGAAARHGENA